MCIHALYIHIFVYNTRISKCNKIHNICICLYDIHIHAGMKAKKDTIKEYLLEINTVLESVDDHGILDHTLASIMPIMTTLRSSVQQKQLAVKNFEITTRFAPAQKNETQLRFEKLKTPGKKPSKAVLKYVFWMYMYSYTAVYLYFAL